ncbi:hypothetical protein ACFRMQ_17235 [Kitasatospora sp. NPDC056783]|uniref:hypothetical protein n=1 Tax=Kitasatospora sp. NPDC056783 TaxID=3345943 RepID=UPI0036B30B23
MRTTFAALLLGTVLLPTAAPVTAAPLTAGAAPREVVNQGYSIPVAGVTDLGALPVLAGLGMDFARLLGQ